MEALILVFIALYIFSCFGSIEYMVDRDVDLSILTLIIVICPILNTILAIKNVKFSETIRKMKGGKK